MHLKSTLTLFLLLASLLVNAQAPFFKAYPSNDYSYLKQFIKVSDQEYAFVTESKFYRVNAQGDLIMQKEIKEGMSSYLQSVLPDGKGNYWIISHVFLDLNTQLKKLYKVAATGAILSSQEFPSTVSFDYQQLIRSGSDGFFLVYKELAPDNSSGHIAVWAFNDQGNRLWNKTFPDKVYHRFTAHASANGFIDICYMTEGDKKVWLLTTNKAANTTQKEILHQAPGSNVNDITYDFCAAPAGGYVFAGDEISTMDNNNCFLYETDVNGKVIWERRFNVYLNDQLVALAPVSDGYILLCNAGNKDMGIDELGDIALIKTDLQGNRQWVKAFGSTQSDFARQLYVDEKGIVVSAQCSYPGGSLRIPALFRTDVNGNINSNLPFTLSPASDMKPLQVPQQSEVKKLIGAVPARDGGFITGSNILNDRDGRFYPVIAKTDRQGNAVWHRDISAAPAPLRVLKKLSDGSYIAVAEHKDIFFSEFSLTLFADDGAVKWTTTLASNTIKDIISTSDGGLLVTGARDISFVNYELVLFKLAGDGSQQWSKTIGQVGWWESGRALAETPEHDFLVVGSSQKEYDLIAYLQVLKVDSKGNTIWNKTYNRGAVTNLGTQVLITAGNNYVIAGSTSVSPFTDKNLMLVKIDAQGGLIWEKAVNLHRMEDGFSLKPAAAGGFYVAGSTGEPQAGRLEKFAFAMELDANANVLWTKYYGKEGLQTTATDLLILPGENPVLLGTTQDHYGKEWMFFADVIPGTLPPPLPPPGTQPAADSIILFPNPAVTTGNVLISNAYRGTVHFTVYDAAGRQMAAFTREKTTERFLEPLQVNQWPQGIYYVVVAMRGKRHTHRMLVGRK